jgi:predicted nucleic-acid-binding protein
MAVKNKVSLIDTNIVIRYLLGEGSDIGVRAKELLDQVQVGGFKAIITESVLAECVYILDKVYKVPKLSLAKSLSGILQYKGIVNEDKHPLVSALHLFSKTKLDFVDCILSEKAKFYELDLATFDKELIKIHSKKHN